MAMVHRRRILRQRTDSHEVVDQTRIREKLDSQLSKERATLDRWMTRLRRAFHAVEKSQSKIRQLERRAAKVAHT